jgi:hypothetical protein
MLRSLSRFAFAVSSVVAMHAQFPVVMNRYDPAATSANTREKALNASNVNPGAFGKLYSYYVDGSVYAQPLYLPAVPIRGRGAHNVLYVATMNDKIYAFDADSAGPPLWMRSLTDEMAGVTPVPVTGITNNNDLNLVGNIGIESTPVIASHPTPSSWLHARSKTESMCNASTNSICVMVKICCPQ